jgi:hypothetical protein
MYVLPSGNVFVGGGARNNILLGQVLATTNSVEIRNATTGNWSGGPSLPQAVVLPATAQLPDGSIAILGGGQGNLAQFTSISNCYRFTEGQGYTTLSFLPVALMNHALNALGDGTFLISGGLDPSTIVVNTGLIWTP